MSVDEFALEHDKQAVDVSFVVACFNPGDFLEPAIKSALSQTGVNVEVVVVDDGSTDGSVQTIERMRETEPRIRLFRTPQNCGPAGARNVGLKHMRGEWYAVLDADDLLLPDRSTNLIGLANTYGAHIVADNMIPFGDGGDERPMFTIAPLQGSCVLTLSNYIARSRLFGSETGPGYLKPMIRREVIKSKALSYNEDLFIAEDDELMIRALSLGLTYRVCDYAGYFYRRHRGSISHRLSLSHLEKMMMAEEQIAAILPDDVRNSGAYEARRKALKRAHAFTQSVEALKAHTYFEAIMALLRHPSALTLYSLPLKARIRRMLA